MEVAMTLSRIKLLTSVLWAALGGAMVMSLVGCGDMLTWAAEAKRQGIEQYNDGRYAEAAGSFRNAARQDPIDPETEYWLGLSYEQTHSYHEAIVAYKTALRLQPDPSSVRFDHQMHDNAFDRLARVIAQTDSSSTETDLIVKTASDSRSSDDYRLIGRIFRYRGDADTALDNYRRAVQLNPDNYVAQKELGLYLELLVQNQEAGQVLRDAYRLNQQDQDIDTALRRIGMVPGPGLLAQGQLTRSAIPVQSTEDELSPASPAAHISGPVRDSAAPHD
jgi:tetratricopeptide (TPR) repeat protein